MSFPKEESDSSIKDDQIRRAQLQIQFHGTRREDFQSIEAYVKRLKSIADSLVEIGDEISNSDKVLQLLAGLPNQYLPLKNIISSRCPLPNFEEASSMLYMQEDILLHDPSVVGAEQSSSGFCTVDKFVDVVETLGTVVAAAGTLGLGTVFAAPLGTVVGAVGASRMIVFGAVSAMSGWKNWQALRRK
ncbi:uncharacterized protein [Solanum tuberosum]|uniref:Uncharacterized protein n=1 Tax=Solanum tuberosum TaxID=4113 RepID=M1BZA8_SOLTU|nr:PREDICTED: uncharacterized protein LOC102604170 [Solanum tuberosum]KAH0724715.1 hypothetical protein KY284_000580 [Solanum tuberosum]